MVAIQSSSRKSGTVQVSYRTLFLAVTAILACFAWLYDPNLKGCGFDELLPLSASSPVPTEPVIASWEQLEVHMDRLDPAKAERWRQFLVSENAPQTDKPEVPPVVATKEKKMTLQENDEERVAINAQQVQEWRRGFEAAAAIAEREEHQKETRKFATNAFKVSTLRKCTHVFLDFGSNIGDSLNKLIDAYFPEVDLGTEGLDPGKRYHHIFNSTSGDVGPMVYNHMYNKGTRKRFVHRWVLPKWVKEMIDSYNKEKTSKVYPENYCFYGVEGNPHFTSLLRMQEIQIMNMQPRPIQHLHFLTEHVGAGKEGPTTLFLDTVNTKDNFWGSSMMQSHADVVRSGNNTGVPVMGITLTKLLKETVLPGGHVMIKIDIEGGEYQLLEEAINSTILCKLVQEQGVRIDMLNEPHNAKIVGSEEPGLRWKAIQGDQKIRECGVGLNGRGRQF